MNNLEIVIIGYSGHAYVVCDILLKSGYKIKGYCDSIKKELNPFDLNYLGSEDELTSEIKNLFIAVGDNYIRDKIYNKLNSNFDFINAIHPSAIIGYGVTIDSGVMIAARAVLNPQVRIGLLSIINTGAIIEHDCTIGNFVHIAPGAVLAGNVTIGNNSFIGANAVIKQGIFIGKNVTVGAGTVIIQDVPDGSTVVGNPGRIINR